MSVMQKEVQQIILFGAGNLASNVVKILSSQGVEILGYISTEVKGTCINGIPVLGNIDHYLHSRELQQECFHIAIGENSLRYRIMESVIDNAKRLQSVISDKCIISDESKIGKGTYVSHGAIIQHDASIGVCCIVDTGVIIEHHVQIGDYVNVSPGVTICGGVNISKGAILGAGATVIEKVSIGENSLIGAGSVVTSHIEANVIAVGNPAKPIKKREFYDKYLK